MGQRTSKVQTVQQAVKQRELALKKARRTATLTHNLVTEDYSRSVDDVYDCWCVPQQLCELHYSALLASYSSTLKR
jgi:hypothetical protein